jgi:imidazolonepropionase-like amidohydrolase
MLAIAGGTVLTVADGVKPGHTILVSEGKIQAVLATAWPSPDWDVIDASGKIVLPGLVDARTSVGLYGDGSGLTLPGCVPSMPSIPMISLLAMLDRQE